MPSKRDILAHAASFSGATRVLEGLAGRASLLILTFHRVGDARQTAYDPGTFSCTAEELDWQVGWLKGRYPILTLDEAVEVVHGRTVPSRTVLLLTFDDGYLDNYEAAFPIMRRHGVSATFFLPTAFVGNRALPWWDEIAFMVKRSKETRLTLSYPVAAEFDLSESEREVAVLAVLNFFKQAAAIDTERFLSGLEAATGCGRPGASDERCFMNWDEARAMQRAGMCFGSHTHTHEILSRLPYAEQLKELQVSRRICEAELDREIDTLAYPRGWRSSFSAETMAACRVAPYGTAFSFYSGVNVPGKIDPLDVLRIGVDGESRAMFRLRTATYAAMGRGLV